MRASTSTLSSLSANPTVEGRIRGGVGGVQIEIQVATDDMFASIVGTAREHARSRGETNLALNVFLADETTYYWRARAMATAVAGGSRVTSAWSDVASFKTRAVRLGTPRPLAPIDGATVGVGTHFRVRKRIGPRHIVGRHPDRSPGGAKPDLRRPEDRQRPHAGRH